MPAGDDSLNHGDQRTPTRSDVGDRGRSGRAAGRLARWRTSRRWRRVVLATLVLALALPAGALAAPNIVVVTVDDMPMSAFGSRTMPNTVQLLGGQGTTFTNSIVTTPLCCPSRASLLTGQYGHNNGVLANIPGYGALRSPENILPAWLQEADYNTAHVGKYLNNYEQTVNRSPAAPAGWDEWHTFISGDKYYDYNLAVNGQLVHY